MITDNIKFVFKLIQKKEENNNKIKKIETNKDSRSSCNWEVQNIDRK